MKHFIARNGVSALVLMGTLVLLLWHAPGAQYYLHSPDHGLQLCGGQQVLQGKIPCRDLFTPYGPLVFFTSALGITLSGSLVGETILCCLGYAVALWIVYTLVSRHAGRLAGLLAWAATYLMLARFYKWYVWMFPLAVLAALDGYRGASGRRRLVWAFAAGMLVGIEWLFRFDLGTLGLAAAMTFIAVVEGDWSARSVRRCIAPLAVLIAAAAVPLGAWFGLLLSVGGLAACRDFTAMLIDGSHSTVAVLAVPLPVFDWSRPLSATSVLSAAYAFTVLTYFLCGISALKAEIRHTPSPRSRAMLATMLIGLSVLHQALHRCDVHHLMQVIPPAVVGAALLLDEWLRAWRETLARRRVVCFGGIAYFALILLAGEAMFPVGRFDMARPTLWPRARMSGLAHPLAAIHNLAIGGAFEEIQRRTRPDESILVYPAPCQYYYFADRRMSGLFSGYFRGELDDTPWAQRNREAIAKDMPKVVMVVDDFLALPPAVTAPGRSFVYGNDAIDALLRDACWTKVFDRDGIVLLERGEGTAPSAAQFVLNPGGKSTEPQPGDGESPVAAAKCSSSNSVRR